MISAAEFIAEASRRGFDFYTGVPCSFLTPLIDGVLNDTALRYVGATSEGEAVAIAAGAWLAGRSTIVMCQNSGLGNAVNPLTSLNAPFRIPTLLITTWRGQPGIPDEPQHKLMGEITQDLLDVIRIEQAPFPRDRGALGPALAHAVERMTGSELPFAFVMEKDSVRGDHLTRAATERPPPGRREDLMEPGAQPSRAHLLERFLTLVDPAAAVVVTTGKSGRELFTLADRRQHFYQVGSMGGAVGMALGIALNAPLPVVVLDGDGAALMKLGSMATVGAYRPANLIHLLLDNGVHDSTGGQPTVSAHVDFAGIAQACGYRYATSCTSLAGFEAAFRAAAVAPKPAFIHARVAPGSMGKLGRPTVAPEAVARRFKAFIAEGIARTARATAEASSS